jgi:hypothetical protein
MTIRTAVAGAALALVLACGAAPAGAATVRVSGDTLEFRAAPGEVNLLSISRPAAQIVLRHRPGFSPPPISAAGGGCTSSGTEAQCPAAGVTKLDIDLGDGDDQLDSALSVSLSGYSILKGGAGNDVMYGTGGDDDLYGGPGNDRLDGNDGADFIHGGDGSDWAVYDTSGPGSPVTASLDGLANDGAGGSLDDNVDPDKDVENLAGGEGDDLLTGDDSYNMLDGGGSGNDHLRGRGDSDVLDGGSGDDVLDGGEGTDGADYSHRAAPVTVDLEAGTAGEAGERDTLIDVNAVGGGSGNDTLRGSNAYNAIAGGRGDDTIDGRGGGDELSGGDGADAIAARDGELDAVDCGAGFDSTVADANDLLYGCESADLPSAGEPAPPAAPAPAPEPPARDRTAPQVDSDGFRASPAGTLSTNLRCPASEEQGCRVGLRVTSLRKLRTSKRARARRLTLGSKSYTLRAGERRKLTVPLSRTGKRMLRKYKRLTVELRMTLTDVAGNASAASQRFKLSARHKKRR